MRIRFKPVPGATPEYWKSIAEQLGAQRDHYQQIATDALERAAAAAALAKELATAAQQKNNNPERRSAALRRLNAKRMAQALAHGAGMRALARQFLRDGHHPRSIVKRVQRALDRAEMSASSRTVSRHVRIIKRELAKKR